MSPMPVLLEPSEPYEFAALARYNSEIDRGIAHTPEWDALMEKEQRRFNEKQEAEYIAQGGYQLESGTWAIPGPPATWWRRLIWRIQDFLP